MLRRSSAVAVVATVVGGWLGQAPALADQPSGQAAGGTTATGTEHGPAVPSVWPRPQTIKPQGTFAPVTATVTLVADGGADPYALDEIDDVLRTAGAQDVVRSDRPGPGLTVYAGAPAAAPLAQLHAPAQGDLPDGGYRLAVGGGTVAMDGRGDDGLYHAAQTLRQLVIRQGGAAGFAGVTVRDWPAAPVRGVTEGFYGEPWTQAQRLAQLDFMARTKQNRYLYAPGDDPYRQTQWRVPYPAAQRAGFRALAERAARDHVTLAWAVAPGQSMCFGSPGDLRALERKMDAMWALGVRAFQLQFQDVSYSEWHCGADTARFGTGPDAAARAQASVANAVAAHLQQRYGAADLSLLPTEYYQDGPTPYRTALAAALDPGVEVAWTGVGVLPQTITGAQVAGARAALRHPLLTVDDYPVNDFAPGRLFLGPYTGREPALATVSAGVLASAMQQPAASRIPLFTAADYAWNPGGYDPAASWQAAVDDLAGPDPRTRAALRALAGNESSSALGGEESAYLRPLVTAFQDAMDARDPQRTQAAATQLRSAFTVLQGAKTNLRALADGTFGDEVGPWLDRMSLYGAAGGHAVDMLLAQARNDGAAAWRARQALDRDRAALAQGTVKVGGQVLDDFLSRAVDDGDAWAGVGTDGRTATTSMASGHGTDPSAMVDGKDGTAWASDAPPQPDDTIGVDLGTARPVSAVRVAMGDGSGSDDFLHDAVLEVADDDGSGWRRIAEYHDQPVIEATLPPGTRARRIRLRATDTQSASVMVREFSVTVPGQSAPKATGPANAAAVVDGDLTTSSGPGPVTVGFGGARLLDTVTIAAAGGPPPTAPPAYVFPPGPPNAPAPPVPVGAVPRPPRPVPQPVAVEVRTGGVWRRIGALDPSGWTEVHAGVLADAVRLSDAAGVHEIVPWFADAPRVTLDQAAVLDAEAGSTATLTARVASGLPRAAQAAVAVGGAPHGVTVTAPAQLTLPRGATAAVPLTVRVAADTAPGTYTVPVRVTVAGRTVERRLTLRTHPHTGGPDLVPGSVATSSGDETADFPAAAVADGDPATRWSSPVRDDAWVQVELPAPARVGKVVLRWQDAYAARYEIQVSTDGTTWHTAATVADGAGGTETVWLDGPDAAAGTRFLRVQGVRRATKYGYSLYSVQAYAVTG
ncbi:beta-N-acetylglucosaminidase domain-containing protein [Actinacidiphila acididurans]|uniref:beta-N-acetylglucosaminidase domain-containing protein n=1 Tax=Actinacidiphila acididurans TaxID=2784346 RepID=UPI0027DB1728|nr:beta-N-acetylglucosaminidase domain-containing protein [Actinacidiphila acididurans]